MTQTRLLLADDHYLMLDGLRLRLQEQFEVVAALGSGKEVVRTVRRLKPDVVLLDLGLPDKSGLEVAADLRKAFPRVRILVVTMNSDRVMADAAFQAGAHGFIPKDAEPAELIHAIEEVLAGRRYLSPIVAEQALPVDVREMALGLGRLTTRQREIVRMLGEGMSSVQIAQKLCLSLSAITFHRGRIRKALGIQTEFGLLRLALVARLRGTSGGRGG